MASRIDRHLQPDLGTEDILVVAELAREHDLENSREIESALRTAIVAELGVAARAVYLKLRVGSLRARPESRAFSH